MRLQPLPEPGLSVKRGLSWIPECGIDDQGKWVVMYGAAMEADIDRTSVWEAIKTGRLPAQKDDRGRWVIRLRHWTRYIERYRHAPLHTRRGKKWRESELKTLSLPGSHREIAGKLGRSPMAVKIMRMRMKRVSQE